MAPEEIIISRHLDLDVGILELIETWTQAMVNGVPGRPLIFRQWIGKLAELDSSLIIASAEDPPIVTEDTRAAFRKLLPNAGDFKKRVARLELELARYWIAEAKMDFPLNENTFVSLLRIDGFTINSGRLTVWL